MFPANAGTQEPPSAGWQPKGHWTTQVSTAQSVLSLSHQGLQHALELFGQASAIKLAGHTGMATGTQPGAVLGIVCESLDGLCQLLCIFRLDAQPTAGEI